MNNHLIFQRQLLKHSERIDFKDAKKEWSLLESYKVKQNKPEQCICTKKIFNIFIIENKQNNNLLKIGSDCFKHIDKSKSDEAKKDFKTKLDMQKNPEKYCLKCNTKKRKQRNEDIYLCRCQKLEYELNEINIYGEKNCFTFGKYKERPFINQAKNYSYINWLSNIKTPTANMCRFLKYVKKLNSLETEKLNIKDNPL